MSFRALRVIIGIAVVLLCLQQTAAQAVFIETFKVASAPAITYTPLSSETITVHLTLRETADVVDSLTAVQLFFADSSDCDQASIESNPVDASPTSGSFPVSLTKNDKTVVACEASLQPDQGNCADYGFLCADITVTSSPASAGDHSKSIELTSSKGGELNCTAPDVTTEADPVIVTTVQAEGGAALSFSSKTLIAIGSILVMLATRLF
ncbi:uncharacterized protein [Ptychodera flava]|uniref:uncharacterized protein n=1 Tax=Ptychodera flava TaxID=63121 RepID=UPI003969EAC9